MKILDLKIIFFVEFDFHHLFMITLVCDYDMCYIKKIATWHINWI